MASQTNQRHSLSYLLGEIIDARASEHQQTRLARNAAELHTARARTLRALLNYADLIDSLGWPVPRSVCIDIALHRSLCGPWTAQQRHPHTAMQGIKRPD